MLIRVHELASGPVGSNATPPLTSTRRLVRVVNDHVIHTKNELDFECVSQTVPLALWQ